MVRPSIDALSRNRPKGRGTMPRGNKGTWKCLLLPPAQGVDAQDQRAIRVSFLLGPFLWTSNEKDLSCGSDKPAGQPVCTASPPDRARPKDRPSETHIQNNRRVSDSLPSNRLLQRTQPPGTLCPSTGLCVPGHTTDYCPLTRIAPASSMRSPAACSTLTIRVRYSRRWRVIRKFSRTNSRALWPISSILCRSWSR